MIDIDSNGTLSADSLEEVVMGLIINSGRARSLAYKALTYAKEGKFVEAMELMEDSKEALTEAHKVQTKMIETDMGEGKIKVSLILVHEQVSYSLSDLEHEQVLNLL